MLTWIILIWDKFKNIFNHKSPVIPIPPVILDNDLSSESGQNLYTENNQSISK